MSQTELDAIAGRIERLVTAPDEVRDLLGRVARPVLRVLRWQPKIQTRALAALVEALQKPNDALQDELEDAIDELGSNVRSVERAAVVHGRIPIAYATWLWKLYQLVRRASQWQKKPATERARLPLETAGQLDLLPPLAARTTDQVVHVVAIDPLLDAAKSETELLGRRRRLLEAAREALLDAAAALDLESEGVLARQSSIAREIARIDRLQAAGIAPELGLTHQLRQALTRGETQRAHAALVAMDELAHVRGDGGLSALTARGLDSLWQGRDRFSARERLDSLARSSLEVFGDAPARSIDLALDDARLELGRSREQPQTDLQRRTLDAAERQLDGFRSPELLRAALAVDGCFDVGGVLTPVRVSVEERRLSVVDYPTPELVLVPARNIQDVRDAVIEDPRRILLDLAAGRLLARRFVAEEVRRHEKTVLKGEVRVYLLDGSSSMLGARAAMRDAILVAELTTLRARLEDPSRALQPVLYYRYFTKKIEPARKVQTLAEVDGAITEALSKVRRGGTDIELALLASFELVRDARASDPDLARAQIVLVTDGNAPVDEDRVVRARESVGELPVGVSIIALGEENPTLRRLAARQRARGERVFYHFVPDEELHAIVQGQGSELPLHLPEDLTSEALGTEFRQVVEEIEQHRRGADAHALQRARTTQAAFQELALPLDSVESEGLRARIELLERDWTALARRFDRWFPAPPADPGPERDPGADGDDLELLVTLLASLVEVVELASSDPAQRRVDTIELFERLLTDAGLTPWRTHQLLERHPHALAPSLRALRTLAGMDAQPS